MDIKIIYEDEELLVIDKPSGITVNKSDTTKDEQTVQDFSEKYLKIPKTAEVARENFRVHNAGKVSSSNQKAGDANANSENSVSSPRSAQEEFASRGGIVHRLDKETSGILLIAKSPASFLNLQNQFKERKVEKTYIALVHGEVKPDTGEINVPVGRLSYNRKRFGIVAGGRDSVTNYRVISNFKLPISNETLTLLELYPKTGRTHQIRVHLKYFGHPVFSDPLYGGRKITRKDRKVLPRLFLHSEKISFYHPIDGKLISLESSLPKELEDFLLSLESQS